MIKILIQGYSTFGQNAAGGVNTKIRMHLATLAKRDDVIVKYFNAAEDKVVDYDIIHFFKANIEHLPLIEYAHKVGVKVVISSITAFESYRSIKCNLALHKLIPYYHSIHELSLRVLQLADVIISETQKEADFISKAYGISREKICAIANGIVNPAENADVSVARDAFGLTDKVVLVPAIIDRNKNQLSVIKALRATDIPVLLMGGNNPLNPKYYDECVAAATPNIKFTGWVQYKSPLWASCYANAKVVVLPSFKEIFGIALWEGAAAGANAVATNALTPDEWGFGADVPTVDPHSVSDIRDKVIAAYRREPNPELAQKVRTEFSWDTIVDRHMDIYRSLL